MELFLYEWWPIRSEARLFDRLSGMPVRIEYTNDKGSEAWRWDWPAVSPAEKGSRLADSGQPGNSPPAIFEGKGDKT